MNFIKKLRPFDYLILVIIIAVLTVGALTFSGKRATSSNQIEATTDIDIEIYLRGVTSTSNEPVFKSGEETFITIRNVPYTELTVVDVNSQPRKTLSPSGRYTLVNDPSQPAIFDAVVTITDTAKITKDGAVVGGNKIKMGLPVTLEGESYKFNGTISDVRVSNEADIKDSGENVNVG